MNPKFARPLDRPIIRFMWAMCVVAAAFWLRATLSELIGQPLPPYVTFYPAVMFIALFAGFWPGVLSIAVSAILIDFWLLPPVEHFSIRNAADVISLFVFIGFGTLLCFVADRFRRNQSALADASARLKVQEAKTKLVEVESKFKLMANSIPQLCWMADPKGEILWYNDRWYEYTGTTFEQMKEAGCQSVYDPTFLPKMMELKEASLLTGEKIELVAPIRGADGEYRLFLARVELSKDKDGNITNWFGSHTDIHDRHLIEAKLRSTNQRLELALEAAGLGEWELNFKTKTATRSPRHAQIFGYASPPQNWNVEMFVHHVVPEHSAEVAARVAASRESGTLEFETRIQRADGEIRWIWVRGRHVNDEDGNPDRMYGTVMDITERKHVETALRANEERLALALEVAAIGEWEVDAKDFVGTHSQRHAEIFGYPGPLPQWSTALFLTHVTPEARPRIEALVTSAAALGSLEFEAPIIRADGEFRWIWCRRRTLLDADQKPYWILGVVQDITDRKKIETDLRANTERLDLALEVATIGEWEVDVVNRRGTHSQRHAEIYGYPSPLPRWTMEIFLSHVVPESRLHIESILKSEAAIGSLEFEVQIRRVDGEVRWVWIRRRALLDELGNPVRIQGVALDITDRKRIETTLRENKERLDLAVRVANIGMWDLDIDTHEVFASPRHLEIFGFKPDQAPTHYEAYLATLMHDCQGAIVEAVQNARAGEEWDVELQIRRLDGELRWIWLRGTSLADLSQSKGRISGTVMDITDRKRTENVLKENQERLNLAIRVADIGVWDLNLITHEVAASQRHLNIFGYESMLPELNFEGFLAHVLPEYQSVIVDKVENTGIGKEWDAEVPILRVDGELRWIWVRGLTLHDELDEAARMTGTVMDITDRKNIETTLRANKERLDLALKVANLGEWEMDVATGSSTVSPRHDEIFGYPAPIGDWTRELFLSHVLPEYHHLITERLENSKPGDEWDIEFQIIRADGQIRWVWDRGIIFFDEAGRATKITGTVVDITNQRNAENELRANRDRLDLALQVANLGEWDVDLRTRKSLTSQRHAEIFGYPSPAPNWDLEGFISHVLPEYHPLIEKHLKGLADGLDWDLEVQIRRVDGQIRWIWDRGICFYDDAGQPIRITGTVMDITERKLAETELRASKDRLALAIKVANLGEFDLDLKTGVSSSSQRHAEIFGYASPPPDWSAELFLSHVLPEYQHVIEAGFQDMAAGRECDVEIKIRRVDGEIRWIWDRAVCIVDENGQPARLTGTVMDITDRKRAEDALRFSEAQLQLFVERTPSAVAMFDRDMRYLVLTRRWQTDYQLGDGDLRGKSHYDLLPWTRESRGDLHCRVMGGETITHEGEHFLLKDGTSVWLSWEMRPWLDLDGSIGGMVMSTQDITARKQAEDVLKNSEARLRLFVEQAPVALAMFDKDMRYIVASQRWMIENGFEGRDIAGLSHYDCYPEMPENWKDSHQRALAGEVVKADEDPVRRHTGVLQWMRWEVQPWRDAAGKIGGVLIFAEDITERKLTEQKLQHVTRIYSMLSEINQAVVREKDSNAMLQAACDIAVNRGLFRMAWIGMVDAASREVVPVNHSGNFDGYLDEVRINLNAPADLRGPATRCIRSGEHTVCNDIENDPGYLPWRNAALKRGYRSSAAFPISVHGEPIGVFNLYSAELDFFSDQELNVLDEMAMDISFALEVNHREAERRKIGKELQWRTAFFEAQLESSPDGILVTDNEGNIVYANRRFSQIWGLPPEVLADGKRKERLEYAISKVKNPQAYLQATNRIYSSSGQVSQDEIEFIDGTYLTRYASPVHDQEGKYYGRIWVFQDITKRRQMEQQLRQSQKMEAVGQLTGGIAHDFNNLLGVILGNLDLLEILVKGNDAALRRVQIAQKAGERGADVTRRLLAFSRSGELKPTKTDLNASVLDVVELARTLGPDLKFAKHIDDRVTAVFVDAAGLENALLNLVVNARDAMPGGGTVTLSTGLRELDKTYPLVEIGELTASAYACISVTDTGTGMSKQVLDRVFEPFYTTKSEGKGTGLGLAMVYGFVKQSGGAINIYSEVGVGTTVTIYLPLADPFDLNSALQLASSGPMPHLYKVLVVDDEPDLIEITRIYLEQMGYEVFEATAAEAALEVARQHPDIDLMITDIIMPGGVNGVQLAYNMREILPNVKIIYSSGFPANAMADRGLPHLDGPMLRKPYHLAEFEAAIRIAME